MQSLAGKCAVVTGAGNGIGREIALGFGSDGASVVIFDRDAEAATRTAAEIEAAGGKAYAYAGDVSSASSVNAMIDLALSRYGSVDILVNNAAAIKAAALLDTSLEMWNEVLATNLTGTFLCSQAAARPMIEKGWGRIVNISSHSGLLGSTNRAAYAASKGGIISLTRVMAVELGEHGITVNAIAPGIIGTRNLKTMEPGRRAIWDRSIPLHRPGNVAELASVARFLASDGASYVNGQTIPVDGGFSAAGLIFDYSTVEGPIAERR